MEVTNGLKKNEEFRNVYKQGKSMANKLLIIYMLQNNIDINRVGFVVSKKKIGKSVQRNRVKRLMKENYRQNTEKVKKGYDIVFVAREGCKNATYHEIGSSILHLFKKMNLVKK